MRFARRRSPRCPPSSSAPTDRARSPRPPASLRPAGRHTDSARVRQDDSGGDGVPARVQRARTKGKKPPVQFPGRRPLRPRTTSLTAHLFFPAHRLVGQVGPGRPRHPAACHTSDWVDERRPRTGAGVATLPRYLRHRWGLDGLNPAAPPPLPKMSPAPRRWRWGRSRQRPHRTARQHVDQPNSFTESAAHDPPFREFYFG